MLLNLSEYTNLFFENKLRLLEKKIKENKEYKEELTISISNWFYAAWWQEKDEVIKQKTKENDPEVLFFNKLTLMCLGQRINLEETDKNIKKLKGNRRLIEYLTIEYFGRSKQYKKQADYLKELTSKYKEEEWPYMACLRSLEYQEADSTYLKKIKLENKTLGNELLKMRCGLTPLKDSKLYLKSLIDSSIESIEVDHRYAKHLVSEGNIEAGIEGYLKIAHSGLIDKPIIKEWLNLAVSNYDSQINFTGYINLAKKVSPETKSYNLIIASFYLIYLWINRELSEMHKIYEANSNHIEEASIEDKMQVIFYKYILNLCISWQKNKEMYLNKNNLNELVVIGESHCLSPCGMVIDWINSNVLVKSCFIMGIKMHHLKNNDENQYTYNFRKYLRAMEDNHLLITIGEIDCRVDEGIWSYYKKQSDIKLMQVVKNTVKDYMNWLASNLILKRFKSVTIQGVPAPAYDFDKKLNSNEVQDFLNIFPLVNELIKYHSKCNGYYFLDVYEATNNGAGISHKIWNIDDHHLKPTIYNHAKNWISN
jgi:hypothetical protein